MTFRAEYQLNEFAEIDSAVSYQYVCVCLLKKARLFELVCLYLLTEIDQIDPILLDLITFYIHQHIVLKIMLYVFADGVIR